MFFNNCHIFLLLLVHLHVVRADMLDLVSPNMLPPAACKHGCAPWSSVINLWNGPTPSNAVSNCAQPGGAVNSREYGSWCFCKSSTNESHTGAPAPPNHPLANQTFYFLDADLNQFWSYQDDANEWFRVNYEQLNAAPITLYAVEGQPHTYQLYNAYKGFPAESSQQWLSFETEDDLWWIRSIYSRKDAMPIQFVPNGEKSAQWSLKNMYYSPNGTNGSTTFVGYNKTGDASHWLRGNMPSGSMNVKLIKALPTNLTWGYCTYAKKTPEMINLQIAGRGSVVVSFVSFHNESVTKSIPTVRYVVESDGGVTWHEQQGVSHLHTSPSHDRIYHMSFVRLDGLTPRTKVTYQVKNDGSVAVNGGQAGTTTSMKKNTMTVSGEWSTNETFTVPHAGKDDVVSGRPDVIDVYGDMGVYKWNNMGNMLEDCVGEKMGLIVHMGDHAYNEGDEDEKRADGYMSAFEPVLRKCPWMPIVGNHEYYDGEELARYLDSTFQTYNDTTETALGGLLAVASFYGPSSSSSFSSGTSNATAPSEDDDSQKVPSGTSRFFSVDYGNVHLIATDMNGYYGLDPCGQSCLDAQKVWLAKDLEAANSNREQVPWIVMLSHYPFYCTGCHDNQETTSAEWYASDGAETYGNLNMSLKAKLQFEEAKKMCSSSSSSSSSSQLLCGKKERAQSWTVKQSSDAAIADLVAPFLQKYGVDVFLGAHWHYYESLWPSEIGTTGTGGKPLQKNFVNPNTTVHMTNGNGGPPQSDTFCEDPSTLPSCTIPSTRKQTTEYSYSRLVVHNASHMEIETYLNKDGSLFDTFMVVADKHGPF